jgi:hypothetical protein
MPSKPFNGVINLDVRNTVPDWEPYAQPKAPDGAPVTEDYPGERPWPFTGGTIERVIVDVSGEPYVDLEKEAIAMMKRG